MTAQLRETLWIDGVEFEMATTPLDDYFEGRDPKRILYDEPGTYIDGKNSALHRGYRGHWEIAGARLLLRRVCVEGDFGSPEEPALADEILIQPRFSVDLARIFRGRLDAPIVAPVPAFWFTGKLRVPLGDRLYYVHAGWGGMWPGERIFYVRKGQIIRVRTVDHTERFLANVQAEVDRERRLDDEFGAVNGRRFQIPSLCWMTDEGRALVRDRLGIVYIEPDDERV